MNRTLNVVRMQLVNKATYIWVPLLILTGAFVLSLAVFALIPTDAVKVGGGTQAPLWYFLFVGVQALTFTFPFSQAMSVTRREFFFGTYLTAAITAAILSLVFLVGGLIELATNGWGMNGWFFYLDWVWAAGPAAALLFYFVIAMLFFAIGFWAATLYKRFGTFWLTATLVGIGAILIGLLWLVGLANAWAEVFTWFASIGATGFAIGAIVLIAVLATASFIPLRRATP